MTLIDKMQNLVEEIVENVKEENLEEIEEKTYKADFEDDNFEIITARTDIEAWNEALLLEDEHGAVFNVFEVDENYDEIREVKFKDLIELEYLELEEEVFRNPGIHICDIQDQWHEFYDKCLKYITKEEIENMSEKVNKKIHSKYPYSIDLDLTTYTDTTQKDITKYSNLINELSNNYKVYKSIEDIYTYRVMARNIEELNKLKDIFIKFTSENDCYITYDILKNV